MLNTEKKFLKDITMANKMSNQLHRIFTPCLGGHQIKPEDLKFARELSESYLVTPRIHVFGKNWKARSTLYCQLHFQISHKLDFLDFFKTPILQETQQTQNQIKCYVHIWIKHVLCQFHALARSRLSFQTVVKLKLYHSM